MTRTYVTGSERVTAEPAVQVLVMALLPFEIGGRFRIESRDCPRCAGTGQYAVGKHCYDCNRIGRLFAPPGRLVLLAVCELLGIKEPLDEHRNRWQVSTPMLIRTDAIQPGMRVRQDPTSSLSLIRDWKKVARTNDAGADILRIEFADGVFGNFNNWLLWQRTLTADEVARAQTFMSARVGAGVTEAA